MESDFTNFEQSLILKELGFDRPCYGYFYKGIFQPCNLWENEQGGGFVTFNTKLNLENEDIVARPLFQQAFSWINEELRKYRKNFDIDSSKFYVNFESPHQTLESFIEILIKIKESEELEQTEEELITTDEDVSDISTMTLFKQNLELIAELRTSLEKNKAEVISLRGKVKAFTKNISDLKDFKTKTKSENIYLQEEVEKYENKNKRSLLEIQKLKTSLNSLVNIREKLEEENKVSKKNIESLRDLIETLENKIVALENKITKIHFNWGFNLSEKALTLKRFLGIIDFNWKRRKELLKKSTESLRLAIDRGSIEAAERLEFLKNDAKIKKLLN
jgi:hypothetical protein